VHFGHLPLFTSVPLILFYAGGLIEVTILASLCSAYDTDDMLREGLSLPKLFVSYNFYLLYYCY
jgi:hypothetical protein